MRRPAAAWLLLYSVRGSGQSAALEVGRPFIPNFSLKGNRHPEQFWAAVQDRRGVMYFSSMLGWCLAVKAAH